MTKVFLEEKGISLKEGDVKMETKIGVIHLEIKRHQRLSVASRSWEGNTEGFFLRASRRNQPS